MTTGTNFPTGLGTRKKYSGNVAQELLRANASTKAVKKTAVVHCLGADDPGNAVTTDFTFPESCIVTGVYLNVRVADAAQTVDVGTGGNSNDPDGFLVAASLANEGVVKGTLLSTGQTLGALMAADEDGAGALVPEPSTAVGGDPLTYTALAGTDTGVFDIIVEYTEVVVEAS